MTSKNKSSTKSFQQIIFDLQVFWANQGCVILQPYDTEMGAGTSHPATTLRALGPDFWRAAFVQPCRRPKDGRYGENPNRTQHYYQFQVILKPCPVNSQQLYLDSLQAIGLDLSQHDIRFVEDDWENPSLGAAGMGWEVWCDGMEITQFTYFQQVGGIACDPVPVEITYGLERVATFVQGVQSHFDLNWNGCEGAEKLTYSDVCLRAEKEFSAYNFEYASTDILFRHFQDCEIECRRLLEKSLIMPAYEQSVKANHYFNLLDARGVISVTERAGYITRVRALVKDSCEAWVESLKQ
ncbi:MAG: glycine--tRNA ligase subunit alpha [Alphaproteobacteria bacterium]|nr:glycine--tRNA ligase subunit alpha [Alphaproteobacteria bacterium]